MNERLEVRPHVAAALTEGRAVVALESSLISHGLPRPRNLETAARMEEAVREAGAVPATIAVLSGRLVAGLSGPEIEELATRGDVAKASIRDLAAFVARGGHGATTVAATMFIARAAGIRVLATGGIGGVHRGHADSLDVSADMTELSRTPVAVICSGAKAVLDLPRTLELLETLGVPVVGYGTDELPGFYSRRSGLSLDHRVDTPEEAAALIEAQRHSGLTAGIVFGNPAPRASAMPRSEVEKLVAEAQARADEEGIRGKAVTPFLLDHLARSSGGRTLEANIALLIHNAATAARIAVTSAP